MIRRNPVMPISFKRNFPGGDVMATANVKVTFLCPIEKVWNTITDLSVYEWRSDIERIKILDGCRFIEYSKDGISTIFKVTRKEKNKLWRFEMENKNIKGVWNGRFLAHGESTTLDFTERVTAKKLYMRPFIGAYLRKQQRQYFVDLKKELGCEEAGEVQIF